MPLAVPCLGGQGCVRFTHSTREENISITWVLKDGAELVKPAAVGDTFLQAAHRHEIPMEGACEGVCACSTCHCIFERSVYDDLPEPSEAEDDMLDQAFGQTPTSRLGCQVTLTEDMNGIRVQLPKATRNFYVVSWVILLVVYCLLVQLVSRASFHNDICFCV